MCELWRNLDSAVASGWNWSLLMQRVRTVSQNERTQSTTDQTQETTGMYLMI